MGSLREIRNRIRAVKNTQKITGAMKLVAASKLKRAQEAIVAARPYSDALSQALHEAIAAQSAAQPKHVLLQRREVKRRLLVVVASDRGLCGPFNTSVLRKADAFIERCAQAEGEMALWSVGRRVQEHYARRADVQLTPQPNIYNKLEFRSAAALAERLAAQFEAGDFDEAHIVYSEFKSAMSQQLVVKPLLPIVADESENNAATGDEDIIYEPSEPAVLEAMIPRYLATEIWRAMLESLASEHGARMTAMDSATKNAVELCDRLTLVYNRARQAKITQELMEIVGGAEALNG